MKFFQEVHGLSTASGKGPDVMHMILEKTHCTAEVHAGKRHLWQAWLRCRTVPVQGRPCKSMWQLFTLPLSELSTGVLGKATQKMPLIAPTGSCTSGHGGLT